MRRLRKSERDIAFPLSPCGRGARGSVGDRVLPHHRHRCLIQCITDDIVHHLAGHPVFGLQDDAVAQHRDRVTLDVVGCDEVTVADRGIGPGDLEECQRSTRAGADCHTPVDAGRMDDGGNIVFQVGIDVHRLHCLAHFHNLLRRG